jgi:hypothetical protein
LFKLTVLHDVNINVLIKSLMDGRCAPLLEERGWGEVKKGKGQYANLRSAYNPEILFKLT